MNHSHDHQPHTTLTQKQDVFVTPESAGLKFCYFTTEIMAEEIWSSTKVLKQVMSINLVNWSDVKSASFRNALPMREREFMGKCDSFLVQEIFFPAVQIILECPHCTRPIPDIRFSTREFELIQIKNLFWI